MEFSRLDLFGSATQSPQLPAARSIFVNNSVVQPVTVVRDLGVWIDSELSKRKHVSRVARIRPVFSIEPSTLTESTTRP